jgi:hypothetical protein
MSHFNAPGQTPVLHVCAAAHMLRWHAMFGPQSSSVTHQTHADVCASQTRLFPVQSEALAQGPKL